MRLALYPGTFDPMTLGHLDILKRALRVFDHVEIAIGINISKSALFSPEERVPLVRECVADLQGVSVAAFEGLIVDHARRKGAQALVRGLRQVSDFEYEFRMAFANRRLHPDLETVFFTTSEENAFISSSIVREIHRWGGDISSFVPVPVLKALQERP